MFSKNLKLGGCDIRMRKGEGKKIVKRSVFEKIFKELQSIHFRLNDLEKNLSNWSPQPLDISESKLISLPDNLRRTYMFVASKGECDATVASSMTGRCRALESNYLNQLSRMGWLNKRKVSKTTIYFLAEEKPSKRLAIKEATSAIASFDRVESNFKKYFADPIDIGSAKKSCKTEPIQTVRCKPKKIDGIQVTKPPTGTSKK